MNIPLLLNIVSQGKRCHRRRCSSVCMCVAWRGEERAWLSIPPFDINRRRSDKICRWQFWWCQIKCIIILLWIASVLCRRLHRRITIHFRCFIFLSSTDKLWRNDSITSQIERCSFRLWHHHTHDMSVHVPGSCMLFLLLVSRRKKRKKWYSHLNVVFIIFYYKHTLCCHGVSKEAIHKPRRCRIHVLCGKLSSFFPHIAYDMNIFITSSRVDTVTRTTTSSFFLPFFSENDWLLERSWWEPIGGHYLMSVRIIRHTGAQDDEISISLVKVWLIHKHEHHHKNLIFSVSTFDDDGLVTTKRFFSCPGRKRGCKAPKSDAIACVR